MVLFGEEPLSSPRLFFWDWSFYTFDDDPARHGRSRDGLGAYIHTAIPWLSIINVHIPDDDTVITDSWILWVTVQTARSPGPGH
jgi:hypothetical protein